MIIDFDFGHTLSGADTGAEGNGYKEQNLTREVGYKAVQKLRAKGHTCNICSCDYAATVNDSLAYRVNTSNKHNAHLYVAIHFNAGGGNGVEVYTNGARSFPEAARVLQEFNKLGFPNHNGGLQDGSHLYVIRHTNATAMLVECCYIDSSDMRKYNAESFADAIVTAITGEAVIPTRFYVVTNYIPQNASGIELNTIWYKYFDGLQIQRWYAFSDSKGIWLESQYMSKEAAQTLANRLQSDNLLYRLVSE